MRQTWRDKILALFGISVDTDDANKKESRRRKQKRVTFNDVCGCEEAKEDLTDVVYYLKHPEDFRQLGIKLPRGNLFPLVLFFVFFLLTKKKTIQEEF